MNRQNWKSWLISGAVAAILLGTAPHADARCWGCGGWGWGGYYSGWWPGYYGWGYGCLARYGCYDCGWSSYYPPYYNGYGCGWCGGWAYDGYQPVVVASNPTSPASTPAAPSQSGPAAKSAVASTQGSGTLTVSVPADAKVTINRRETRSTGTQRRYVSNGLAPGLVYSYVVCAKVVRNGRVQQDTKTVTLTAGQANSVAFDFNPGPSQVAGNP